MTPMPKRPIRILIVDDYPLLRTCLAELINEEADLEVCGEAESPAQALEVLEAARPDVALIDISCAVPHHAAGGVPVIPGESTVSTELRFASMPTRLLQVGAGGALRRALPSDQEPVDAADAGPA